MTANLSTIKPVQTEQVAGRYPRDLEEEDVARLLPHRGDIFFARRIRMLGPDHYLGFVTWEQSSMGIAGHFPTLSIVPAVYLIEAAAQAAGAGMLAAQRVMERDPPDRIGVLAAVRRCTFSKPVLPGQTVVFDLTTQAGSGGFVFVKGEGYVNDTLAASFDLVVAFAPRDKLFSIN